MDIVKLDKDGSTYYPTDLIEGYNTAIWTERYLDPGEFQIVTSKIDEMRTLIPEGSLISLLDSKEVMIVENHAVETDDDGIETNTITGRSATSILDSRVFGGELTDTYAPDNERYQLARESSEKALLLIYDSVVKVPTFPISGVDRSAYDQIPNVSASLSRIYGKSTNTAVMTFGTALAILSGLLAADQQGLRTIRPDSTGGFRATFTDDWGPAHLATYTAITDPDTTLRFDVYDGTVRTADQEVVPAIIFDYESGSLNNPKYLWTIKDYKNFLTMWTSVQEQYTINPPDVDYTISGWDRRVAFVDGSSWQQTGSDSGGVFADIDAKGQTQLAQYLSRVFFDGEISKVSPYKYMTDFFLGDLVTLRADWGLSQNMRVTEYIRTEDASGDRGYPTLVLP